jgi:hypothetical protein
MIDMVNLLELDNCVAVSNSPEGNLAHSYLRPSVRLLTQTLAHYPSRPNYPSFAQAKLGQTSLFKLLVIRFSMSFPYGLLEPFRVVVLHRRTRPKSPNEVKILDAQFFRAEAERLFPHHLCRGQGALRATEVGHDIFLMLLALRLDA